MIPFKQKTNSIIKNTAVIIILLCISNSCFSYLQDSRRTIEDSRHFLNENQRQAIPKGESRSSDTALQRELAKPSPHIRDVGADSRQSRIDARDIRTDFREIRTELRDQRNIETNRNQGYSIDVDQQEDYSHTESVFRDLNNNLRNGESSSTGRKNAPDRQQSRNNEHNSRRYQNYSRLRLQRQLLNDRTQDISRIGRKNFDTRRTTSRYGERRFARSIEPRQIQDRRPERISEDRRNVREDSRIRQRSNDRRTTSRLEERRSERLSERRQIPNRELDLLSENRRDTRNIGARANDRLTASRHDERRSERSLDQRQIQDRALERTSQGLCDIREDSRDARYILERSNDPLATSKHHERRSERSLEPRDDRRTTSEIKLERTMEDRIRVDSRDARNIRDRSSDQRTTSRYDERSERSLEPRQVQDRRFNPALENRRAVQEISRNARNIREESDDRRTTSRFDERTELRQIQDKRLERTSNNRHDAREKSRDARIVLERSDDRRTLTRNIERRLENRRLERTSEDRRNVQENSRVAQKVSDDRRFKRSSESRKIQDRGLDWAAEEDQRNVQEDSRDSISSRQRFNNLRSTSNLDRRSEERRDIREESLDIRRVRELSADHRTTSRYDERHFKRSSEPRQIQNRRLLERVSKDRRDVRENSRDSRNTRERSEHRVIEDQSRISRVIREQPQRTSRISIREADSRMRETTRTLESRLRERSHATRLSRNSRLTQHRREVNNSENSREWARTLRARIEPTNNRRLNIEERRERSSVLRARQEDTTKEQPETRGEHSRVQERLEDTRTSRASNRQTQSSLTIRLLAERRQDSRTNIRQQAERNREASQNVQDERETGKNLKVTRNFRQERRKADNSQTRELSLEAEMKNVRESDSRKNVRDSQSRVTKLEDSRNVEFIPNFKENSNTLINTLQAVVIVALFGQMFMSSKKQIRLSTWLHNLFGKEKVF